MNTLSKRTLATVGDTPASTSSPQFEAVVVGAGPAGVTAVGNLLENRIAPILWVDDAFDGGRVSKYYREVPSNTKVKLFVDFALATTPFRKIVSNLPSRDRWAEPSASDGEALEQRPDQLQSLRDLNQESGCQLGNAADMCVMLTEGLRKTPGVESSQGVVQEARLDEESSLWTVALDSSDGKDTVTSRRLVLCTGSTPLNPPLPASLSHITSLDLDVSLSPTRLSQTLLPLGPTTIGVIGASHSAVLVLMNLSQIALSSKPDLKILWFTRHPLRYAEYDSAGAVIARDNTGLKGAAAVWAKENLEPGNLEKSPVGSVLEKIAYQKGDEESVYAEHLPACQFVIQAIGYQRNPIPTVKVATQQGEGGEVVTPVFDHDKGVFFRGGEKKDVIPGLFGAGIAFPERIVDKKYGHEEFNVGFFKFMKAVKKWSGEWIKA
ncbi:uncharacterized protein K489DRAFT_390846 [Dissoconium aciculare CBS 342.82]|uniref:FAD/NAD(P)-binding domain-containing protein n=1 Tax=Dissoconium aciculare CBS 342.82 TaxID=1314786 RepID=A0A6J3LTN6_9PEZI|nr:uncharacterized protein K489DRAFT_390846 [Dissoconium aciculare CBS 342.82]KAF1819150.1 hypothetical protein K489DRAFT_390846 [Dissoconium aciculare CBS 342.82]